MKFSDGTVESIRSISQRALAMYWQRLYKETHGLPSFDAFRPEPRMHDPKQLVVWEVEYHQAAPILRAMYRGSLVDEAFNEGWTGKTLAEVTPPMLRHAILTASNECVRSGCAIYSILRTKDTSGADIDLERLLLPFGTAGQVKHVVASLQLISLKGDFKRATVASQFAKECSVIMLNRISFP